MKVKRRSIFPHKIIKVRKKRCAPTSILGVIFGKKNVEFDKFLAKDSNICWLFEKCFMFGMTTVAFKLGNHTMM